jgi:hypothetical protein
VLGLERPPRWGIVTVVGLTVANGALFAYVGLRPTEVTTTASFADRVSTGTPTPGATSTPSSPSASPTEEAPASELPPVVAVYGDGYSTGSELGGQGPTGWPALVATEVGAELELHAVSRAGYAAVGTTGQDFAGIATAEPVPDATVTVVFGSRNDLNASPAVVGAGATSTFAQIRSSAPTTELVVVGPAWSSSAVPAALLPVRDAVRDAAVAAGATFVDPLTEGWFGEPATLIAPDDISPTDEGHAYLAEQIAPVVIEALAEADAPA